MEVGREREREMGGEDDRTGESSYATEGRLD